MRKMGEHPLWGHLREDLTGTDVRFWSVYSYLIVYDPTVRPVHILRVISGFCDVQRLV